MNKETNIKDMEMWHVGFGRKHCHQLFKTTTDIMPKMDQKMKQENYKQCVIIFLITTYKILIDKKLINPEMLSEKYIRNHFNDNWTINNLVKFIKKLKYASICIFDALGLVPIVQYNPNNAIVNGHFNDDYFLETYKSHMV